VTLSVEDRLDIGDLLVRYATGIDRRDWDLFRTLFTEDCVSDYGDIGTWHGVEEITSFMEQAHSGAGHTQHRITNQVVTATAEGATARSYVDSVVMGLDGADGVQAIGFYDDVLVRADGRWQVARRSFTLVLMQAVANLSHSPSA
jgi:uncharacterized protein (TIGR02246 family)